MKNYLKPEVEIVSFATEVVNADITYTPETTPPITPPSDPGNFD